MNKDMLKRQLQALANGKESANTPLVEAYLADEGTNAVARLLERSLGGYSSRTPLLPPSNCLVLLD